MKDSRRRLVMLAAVYFGAVSILLIHLGHTMVVDHGEWLRRSYVNRWAFRDVPTKRGSVRDRRGELLVQDVPTSALEFHYREFRRRHPCGTALHCANLIRVSRQSTELAFSPATIVSSSEICLGLPLQVLRGLDGDTRRDVRFYLTSLLAALTDESRYRLAREIGTALAGEGRGAIVEALGLRPDRLRVVFHSRLAELEDLAGLLRPKRDFWADLRASEVRRRTDAQSEFVARRLYDGLAYADARRLARRSGRHPGLRIRPSVARQRVAVEARWDTLAAHIGVATAEWAGEADRLRRDELLQAMAPRLAAMAGADETLPEHLRSSVADRLLRAMSTHMVSEGRVGRSGIELDQDAVLRGNAGMHWVSRGRRRRDIGLWSSFDVTPGDDVYLTVDLRLQHLLEQAVDAALAQRGSSQLAAIAVIDPNTGDVLAVASRPSLEVRRKMRKHGVPDPAISWDGTGFIGSLAKPLILAEHLDAKRRGRPFRDPLQFDTCQGSVPMQPNPDVPFRRRRLRCDHVHGNGVHDCVASLGDSCNYFFFQVAEGLGWDGVRRAYDRFGLYRPKGELFAIGVPRGPAPPPSKWFQAHVPGIPARSYPNPTWQEHSKDIQRRAIGYFVEANVLQMARAYAGIATGRLPELSLVRRRPEDVHSLDLGFHADDLAIVHAGMDYCSRQGTASKLGMTGVWLKTGTAEVSKRKIGPRRYRTTNNAWLAGFVGLAPARLAFACVVYNTEQGGFGAKVAGPMFEIFLRDLRSNPQLVKDYL